MAAPTPDELVAAMTARGVTITSADAIGILCLLDAITECLEASYPDNQCKQDAILLWAAILLAANTGGRWVTSQHAPSGASQSFGYGSKPWYALYTQMQKLDTAGCTGDLVEDPSASNKPWFRVVNGSRCQ